MKKEYLPILISTFLVIVFIALDEVVGVTSVTRLMLNFCLVAFNIVALLVHIKRKKTGDGSRRQKNENTGDGSVCSDEK